MENCLSPRETRAKCKVRVASLYRWEARGLLHPLRTGGGHRRYRGQLSAVMGAEAPGADKNRCAIHARVSTRKQADSGNLDRWMERLREIVKRRKYVVVGFRAEREPPGTWGATESGGRFDVVQYRDRLARFGFGCF